MNMSTTSEGPGRANTSRENPGSREAVLPDPVQIRNQLARILESREFHGSKRTARFLRYVVEETLVGGADRIKAFSVAVAAFDRAETFNPKSDPIVRLKADRGGRVVEAHS